MDTCIGLCRLFPRFTGACRWVIVRVDKGAADVGRVCDGCERAERSRLGPFSRVCSGRAARARPRLGTAIRCDVRGEARLS